MKKTAAIFSVLLLCLQSFATHIVGGEIYYDHLGGNNYKITLKVYRDCYNGQAPYDNPAYIGVFDSNGNLLDTLSLPFPGSTVLPVTLNSPCFIPPTNICVEEAIYSIVTNLPPITGGYTLAYQRCCRNQTILNLVNPGAVGATYIETIPDPALAAVNSSPRFKNFPPIFLCAGNPLNFDHSAIDPDGDVLVYKLCDPFDGASQAIPQPIPPAGPPYAFVPFQSPYSGTYPMSSSPAIAVNPSTGMLTGTPNMIGQWVVGVCCEEWRGNQLIGIHRRDFQFNVTNCPPVPIASIPSQTTFCFGMTVNFQNYSVNATTYHWDFGVSSLTNDTSNLFQPTYTYAQPGTYTVTLIANPGTPCADTNVTVFQIYPLLAPTFVPPPPQCFVGNSFNFTAGGSFVGGNTSTFLWNFGVNATPQTSSQQNPNGITFNAPGTYTVSLTVSENNCTKTYIDTVLVLPMPVVNFNALPQDGCVPFTVQFTDSSVTGAAVVTYTWDFGDGSPVSNAQNPVHTYTQPGTYNVTLTLVVSNGCTGTYSITIPNMITVHPKPTAFFTANPTETTIFNPDITFTDGSSGGVSCILYFGDGGFSNNCSTVHTYTNWGTFDPYQVVTNQWGCKDTFRLSIIIHPEFRFWIPNAFTVNGDGLNDVFKPVVIGVQDYHFYIFDRWGNQIFHTDDTNAGWDGRVQGGKSGEVAQEDVYVWLAEFVDLEQFRQHKITGHVSLIK